MVGTTRWKLLRLLVWLTAFLPSGLLPIACKAEPKPFPFLEALLYENLPDLSRFGIERIPIAYASSLWDRGDDRTGVPSALHVQRFVREHAASKRIVIDIEHWPLTGSSKAVEASIGKYLEVLRRFKEAAPTASLGFYSMVPHRDYNRAVLPQFFPAYWRWQRENNTLKQMADQVDILYPSLYTFYPDRKGWIRYAEANLREARRIAPGKPVYCFLWPQYHDSTRYAYRFIPTDYWRLQLQTCRRSADGIVIWGGVGKDGRMNGWLPWDPEAPWWKATVEFVAAHR
jgi:hypothetical protein